MRIMAIARGSATDYGAIIDAARILGAAAQCDANEAEVLLERIVSMISRMCRSDELSTSTWTSTSPWTSTRTIGQLRRHAIQ